jgi:hypothetical protein
MRAASSFASSLPPNNWIPIGRSGSKMSSFLRLLAASRISPLAADELGVHQIGPVPLAQCTEGRIAHVLHGRQQQREVAEVYGADAGHEAAKILECSG